MNQLEEIVSGLWLRPVDITAIYGSSHQRDIAVVANGVEYKLEEFCGAIHDTNSEIKRIAKLVAQSI